MGQIDFFELDIKNVHLIKPLWEKLNQFHGEKTKYFYDLYVSYTFENRIKPILEIAKEGSVKVDLVKDAGNGVDIGYCISTISKNDVGEIHSIFIEEWYRGKGFGETLMERALSWLDDMNAKDIKIGVVFGNEEVLSLYAKFGFYPKSYILHRRK